MARIPLVSEEEEGEVSSEKNSSHASSSSSLRFSTYDDDDETGGGQNGRRKGKTFEELATEAIRELRKAESRPIIGANNEDPHEGFIWEILDLTGTDDEEDAEEDEWRRNMEEKVEMAEQREQVTRLVDLVERVVSWMDRETQSSNNPSQATSVATLVDSQHPNTDLAGPSRKRKSNATTSQLPSRAKKADSSGSQRGN